MRSGLSSCAMLAEAVREDAMRIAAERICRRETMGVLANGVGAAALSLHRSFAVLYPCLAMQSMGEMKNYTR
jgi:hypothetical protein